MSTPEREQAIRDCITAVQGAYIDGPDNDSWNVVVGVCEEYLVQMLEVTA